MSKQGAGSKLFFVPEKELALLLEEIKGNQFRAEILLEETYKEVFYCSRQSRFYLMELAVTSEACLVFLEKTMSGALLEKDGIQGYKLTSEQLGFLTNYALMSKNICMDLLDTGITVSLQ